MAYEFRLPDVGEGVAEAEVVRWLVDEGDAIEQDQPVVEVQTDKAIVELSSPVKGKVQSRNWPEGSTAPVGDVLFVVDNEAAFNHEKKEQIQSQNKRVLATPSVRRQAKEMGIQLHLVNGTGKEGRVTEGDLRKHLSHILVGAEKSYEAPFKQGVVALMDEEPPTRISTATVTTHHPIQQAQEIPLSPIRRVIGERLLYSVTHKPHAIHFDELDVEGLVTWRNRLKQDGVSITYTAILLKLVGYTLKQHFLFNAHYDEATEKIRVYDSLSIGIATDTPKGLLVPVIHEVQKKNMLQLGEEITQLTELARNGKCSPDEMKGSTFTISNAGALGGKWAAPIINPPEVAILALHPIEQKPVVKEGIVQAGWRMNVSLAFDHRVLDGADAIRFTQTLGQYTSDPTRVLCEII